MRNICEALEPRHLLAAWSWGPASSEVNSTYYYHVDETGYHWEAEIGEMGQPKTYVYGRLFYATYDETLPTREGDTGPDRADFYARLLEHVRGQYAHRMWYQPVEFQLIDHGGETFEITATALEAPALPPPVISTDAPSAHDWSQDTGEYLSVIEGVLIEFTGQSSDADAQDLSAPAAHLPAAMQSAPTRPTSAPLMSSWHDDITLMELEELASAADRSIELTLVQ